jgi:hypothetical protein
MDSRRKKNNEWVSWALIVLLFALGLSPLALLLLLFKLFGKDAKKQQTEPPPLQSEQAASVSTQQGRAKKAVEQVTRSPQTKQSTAKCLKIFGLILVIVGFAACYEPIDMMLWLGEATSYYVRDLLTALAALIGGGAMLVSGLSMDRSLKRYAKYLAVLGDREAMPIGELARTLGYPTRQVEKDLQKMIDLGYFGGKAYLHMELGYLFRSGQADADFQKAAARQDEPPKEAEEGYSGILRNIRRANDAIADPILSAKIDRLEEITAKIFRAVEEDPKKRGKIDTFLNYYLPTTQKLLDSYAEFESAGVEGENLGQAKQRIENTMDAIVRGFEHQLDELYKADALDVDSDIRVMETMLRRDTATVAQDFGLGDSAAVQQDETN